MKPIIYRRIRRRSASHDAATAKKDNQQEQSFFGEAAHETFFQPAPAIQRKCADCDKEEKVQRVADKKEDEKKLMKKEDKKEDEKLQRSADKKEKEKVQKKETAGSSTGAGNVSSYVNSLNGKGNPLPAKTNHFFSARMGYDFSNVKLHTNKEAAESAKAVNAKAYTVGNNVVFNEGQYNEESGEGKQLMAHELTHVVQQNNSTVQRTPTPVREGTVAEKREYVEDTIHFFERSAERYASPRSTMDTAIFERVIQSWYSMIINQEKIIMNDLNKDAALLSSLRTAYQNALRILISKASAALNKTEDEIFRENNGRIPLWAWQTPHHMETGFSMPIMDGNTVQGRGRSRHIEYNIQGMSIRILPDGIDRSISTAGVAKIRINGGRIGWRPGSGRGATVTRLTGPGTTHITIQIFYKSAGISQTPSGYGRGTTPEDRKGGTVDPRSTTVAFHEANHGLDYLAFLKSRPFPQFTGATGMLVSEVRRLAREWKQAITQYRNDLMSESTLHTHCVGTTSDQFNGVVLECPVP